MRRRRVWSRTEGYSAGSWRCSPVRTIHVRLDHDHGGPTVVPGGGVRVSAPGVRRRRAPRSARSSGNRRARHLTREHVPLADVLAGQVTCSRAGARHGMRDAVPPCEMRYRGETGTGRRNRPRCRPGRPRRPPRPIPPRPTPRRTRRRLEQTATTTFTLHVFKTTPEQPSPMRYAGQNPNTADRNQ